MLGDEKFTFSGVNIYWLGQVINNIEKLSKYHIIEDENNPNTPTGEQPIYSHPSVFRLIEVAQCKVRPNIPL